MATERSVSPHVETKIIAWGKRWRAMPTLKQVASKYGISESTVRRIVKNKGYRRPKYKPDIEELAKQCDSFSSVPRGTNQGASDSV